jgi:acylphosphatase
MPINSIGLLDLRMLPRIHTFEYANYLQRMANSGSNDIYHVTTFFSGRVQGVGFRYHTLQIAKEFDVSGLVRNLADGRVQLDSEGGKKEVTAFVEEVQDRLSVFIRKVESSEQWRAPAYRGFTIGR